MCAEVMCVTSKMRQLRHVALSCHFLCHGALEGHVFQIVLV